MPWWLSGGGEIDVRYLPAGISNQSVPAARALEGGARAPEIEPLLRLCAELERDIAMCFDDQDDNP